MRLMCKEAERVGINSDYVNNFESLRRDMLENPSIRKLFQIILFVAKLKHFF